MERVQVDTARWFLVAAALAAAPGALSAQQAREAPRFGVQANYGNDSKFGVGGRVRYGMQGLFPTLPLSAIASVDVFFPGSGVTWLDLNYNVVYDFHVASAPRVGPYAGAGLNFAYATGNGASNSQLGVNFLGGMDFRTAGRATPFVELRGSVGNAGQLVLTGGLRF
jgi:hypothetical protein